MSLPPGLEPVRSPGAWGFASAEARTWVSEALTGGLRLRDVAAAHPEALELRGRGPVHAVPAPGGRWVVRPYRRGGTVAGPLLGDRHLRLGEARPLAEARASAAARGRGIPTPAVLAGAVYPSGPFYRADIVTEYIPRSRDLAAALFEGPEKERPPRSLALGEAGRLVGRMARSGVEHPDMNARNVLLAWEGGRLVAMLLDLDRCRVLPPGRSASALRMLRRLERSLRKIAARTGASLLEGDRSGLRAAVEARP